MYDLIGDIHGHADALEHLLGRLGYQKKGSSYRHPSRKVIFVGDFVDRGPRIQRVLEIARSMVESGCALAVLGNHELNALAYHSPDPEIPNSFLRPHIEKNDKQHAATLDQLSKADLTSYLSWFRTLPFWLDLGSLRIVHACWDEPYMAEIRAARDPSRPIETPLLRDAYRKGTSLFEAFEAILKGKEMQLPPGHRYRDKDGHERNTVRVKWYEDPKGHTVRTYALQTEPIDCGVELPEAVLSNARPYPREAPPVFIGHYWLSAPSPTRLANNVACLDYSVAKGGYLCAYRWDGEKEIDDQKFVYGRSGD